MSDSKEYLTTKEKAINVLLMLLLYGSVLWVVYWKPDVYSGLNAVYLSMGGFFFALAAAFAWSYEPRIPSSSKIANRQVLAFRLLFVLNTALFLILPIFSASDYAAMFWRLLLCYPWFIILSILVYESRYLEVIMK